MILLYHLVFPDDTPKDAWNAGLVLRLSAFMQQLRWLKKRFEILSLENYVSVYLENPANIKGNYALTFDDGYQVVFDLVTPFLIEEGITATFFTTTSHLENGELLWFVYINALCSEGCFTEIKIDGQEYSLLTRRSGMAVWRSLIEKARGSGNPIEFSRELSRRYPLPESVKRKFIGISKGQIQQIGKSNLLDLGGHTHRHPYLDQIPMADQYLEMQKNKLILEHLSGNPMHYFAYPGGIYNQESITAAKQVGFKGAFALTPKLLGDELRWELPRVDIYSPSLLKFLGKIALYHQFLKKFGY